MTALDTRTERARKREPITTLGETPDFKAIAERLKPASELPDQPVLERIKASRRAKSRTDSRSEQPPPEKPTPTHGRPLRPIPDTDIEPPHESNGRLHAQAVMDERPRFLPVPDGLMIEREFKNGIRVLRNEDATAVALQFADNRRADNVDEKAILHALGQPEHLKFTYQPGDKIWLREDMTHVVENIRDAIGVAGKMDEGRGRAR